MKSAVETLSPTRAKLTVEVPFEELKPSLDAAYKKIAKQINIPGFRKGKVPPMVIDRQVGRGAVLDEAINDALPKLYVQALQDNDLQPLAQPEIDVTKLEDNSLFEFTAEVDVRPSIEVPSYDGLTVEVDDVAVEELVDAGRCSGGDDVAGEQRADPGRVSDELGDTPQQVSGRGALPEVAVDRTAQVDRGGVTELVGGRDPGPDAR